MRSHPFLAFLALTAACTTVNHYHYGETDETDDTDVVDETDDTDVVDETDDTDGYVSHLPDCDSVVPLADLEVDLFGADGHLFYFEVTPAQREAGDSQRCRGGTGGPVYDWEEAAYTCPNWATNLRFVPWDSTTCSDLGKVELELVGQSSFRPWAEIPNFRIDTGEFTDTEFPSGDKHLRLNNGQADSTIVREAVALRIWAALGYPAPPTRFVRTQSNVWDSEVRVGAWAAHNMVQRYKKQFFTTQLPSAVHVWEGAGDPFRDGWYEVDCEWTDADDCDADALDAVVQIVRDAPIGEGFMEATASVVDWELVHANQCLSALTGTGDDWIHNNNNVVLVLRDDGKVQYLPYSTDISGGHPWYPDTRFDGAAYLTDGCRQDPACRLASITACQELIDAFEALDVPTTVVDERCDALEATGLQRAPDVVVCESMRTFYEQRSAELRAELERLLEGGGDTGDTGLIPL